MFGNDPVQNIGIIKDNICGSMVDVKPLRIEKGVVWGLHLQHGVDLFIRPACGGVSIVQTVVGIPCFLHTVVFIALRYVDVDRYAVFCNGRKTAVPLGCSMQISCIKSPRKNQGNGKAGTFPSRLSLQQRRRNMEHFLNDGSL